MTPLVVALAIFAVLLFWAVGAYNRLVALRNAIGEAWAQIDEPLRRRRRAAAAAGHRFARDAARASTARSMRCSGGQRAGPAASLAVRPRPGEPGAIDSLLLAEQVARRRAGTAAWRCSIRSRRRSRRSPPGGPRSTPSSRSCSSAASSTTRRRKVQRRGAPVPDAPADAAVPLRAGRQRCSGASAEGARYSAGTVGAEAAVDPSSDSPSASPCSQRRRPGRRKARSHCGNKAWPRPAPPATARDGRPPATATLPALAGMPAAELIAQMKAFRTARGRPR